jgi:hypothetical protein
MSKKDEELKYAEFFIDRLNHQYGLDYKATSNEKEERLDAEIDVYAMSKKFPTLNLQIRTREKILKEIFANLYKQAKNTGQKAVMGPVINMNTKKWITEAITAKEHKYPLEVKQNLVLLIIGDIGALFNKDYARRIFANFSNSDFKGIYSVHLPSSPGESSHSHNGQIIAIKDIFNNHGAEI